MLAKILKTIEIDAYGEYSMEQLIQELQAFQKEHPKKECLITVDCHTYPDGTCEDIRLELGTDKFKY